MTDVISGLKIFHRTYNSGSGNGIDIEEQAQEFLNSLTEVISSSTSVGGGGQYGYFRTTITIIGK